MMTAYRVKAIFACQGKRWEWYIKALRPLTSEEADCFIAKALPRLSYPQYTILQKEEWVINGIAA